jgi:hypothetical protein
MKHAFGALLIVAAASQLHAQEAAIVYRLGRDTTAIEQFTRTATRLSGELLVRTPAVRRLQYDIALGADGRPTSATIRQRQADGSVIPNAATELRITFRGDSVVRENVFADSTQRRAMSAPRAIVTLPVPAFATLELLNSLQRRAQTDSFPAVGTGAQLTYMRLVPDGSDTMRVVGGPYPMRSLRCPGAPAFGGRHADDEQDRWYASGRGR